MKKISLPIICGLIVMSLDLALWIWFLVYGFLNWRPGIFEEGLLGMLIIHMSASVFLPILGSFILSPFLTNDFIFVVGITQYFFVGYLLGWIILFFKRKFGKQEGNRKSEINKEVAVIGKTQKAKIILINFIYLIFGTGRRLGC